MNLTDNLCKDILKERLKTAIGVEGIELAAGGDVTESSATAPKVEKPEDLCEQAGRRGREEGVLDLLQTS